MHEHSTGIVPIQQPLPAKSLIFIKQGNLLLIQGTGGSIATPTEVFALLHDHLSYDQKEFLYGAAARNPTTGKKKKVRITPKRLYGNDESGRLYTGFGFLSRCYQTLKTAGYHIQYLDWDKQFNGQHQRPNRYQANFENVERNFEYRPRQKDCLESISKNLQGVVHAVTGYGKRIMIVMACLLYPKAKIHIVIRGVPLVNQMVAELTRYIPNIGQVGGGRNRMGDRITVFTRDSLANSDFDADFLFGDESHELVTDEGSKMLANYQSTRNFAFTATPTGRSDGSDPRLEMIFGPIVFFISYWDAVDLGLVVPIRVEWRDVLLSHNPAAGLEDVNRKRWGIWFNDERNDLIANDVISSPEDQQYLVLTDTVYHAVELYKRVYGKRKRNPVLVYDKIDLDRFERYQNYGDISRDIPQMTIDLKEQYRLAFERGEIDAIATKTWQVGIDPTYLQRLFIADSFRSEIKAQQAPGRASRVNDAGKEIGIVRDYRDQFDEGFCDAAQARSRIYESLRWEQVIDIGGGQFISIK